MQAASPTAGEIVALHRAITTSFVPSIPLHGERRSNVLISVTSNENLEGYLDVAVDFEELHRLGVYLPLVARCQGRGRAEVKLWCRGIHSSSSATFAGGAVASRKVPGMGVGQGALVAVL
ncbi:hypothetical protein D3C81_1910840 [compost metagenome]